MILPESTLALVAMTMMGDCPTTPPTSPPGTPRGKDKIVRLEQAYAQDAEDCPTTPPTSPPGTPRGK